MAARQTTLATRLAVGAAVIALVPMLAISATFLFVAQQEIRKQVNAALLARAQGLARLVQSSILDPLSRDSVLRTWASDPRLSKALSSPAARDECQRFLAAGTRGRVVIGAQLVDRAGQSICASAPDLALPVQRDSAWFKAAAEGTLASEGVATVRGTRTLPLAAAVSGEQAGGVLRVWYDWDAVSQLVDGVVSQSRRSDDDVQLQISAGADTLFDTGGVRGEPLVRSPAASGATERSDAVVAWARNDVAPTDPGAVFVYAARLPRAVAFASQRLLLRTVGVMSVLAALIAALAAWWFSRRLIRPLEALGVGVERIVREGDLAQRIEAVGDDEIGRLARSFAAMVGRLREVPQSLRQQSEALSREVTRLDHAAREQNERIARQAAALQEAQVTAQQIRQTSTVAAERAGQVLEAVQRADEVGRGAQEALTRSLGELEQILKYVEAISGTMDDLNQSTSRVAGITGMVKDLADQSNMLALNAAIEAVRSGEHGRGFGVVAREIRNLADQSIQATRRVQENIEGIRSGTARAVAITEQGTRGIAANLQSVRSSGESIRELGTITSANARMVRDIASAVSQQNAGIEQVFGAVRDLSNSMSDLLRLIEESTASVRHVGGVSDQIGAIVGSFRF